MSAVNYELNATVRQDVGKGASRRLRRSDFVPAIIYGGNDVPTNLTLAHNDMLKLLRHESAYSHILTVNVSGQKQQVLLKALQRHPVKPRIVHVDFLRVNANEKIHVNVPLHFLGEEQAPGVKIENGVVSHLMIDVEISCLPANLPEFIEVDISSLSLGQSIHLSELKLPKGVEIVALAHHGLEHDATVVTISATRATTAADAAEDAAVAADVQAASAAPGKDAPKA